MSILAAGWVIGLFFGAVASYVQVRKFTARAFVGSPDHAAHAEKITPLRSEMVVRRMELDSRWMMSFPEAAKKVGEMVKLRSSKDGVEILVESSDSMDAYDIARDLAVTLNTPAREKEMAARGIKLGPYTDTEEHRQFEREELARLLRDEAIAAGYEGAMDLEAKAAAGDAQAARLIAGENFARRWEMFKQATVEVGICDPPGEPFRLGNASASMDEMSEMTSSPNVRNWLHGFAGLGLAIAGAVIAGLFRWKPAFLRPHPAVVRRPRQPVIDERDQW